MSSPTGRRASIRTSVASRKKRENEDIEDVESTARSAKRAKRIEGFAYLGQAQEELEAICQQFSILAERRWMEAHNPSMEWYDMKSIRNVRKSLDEQVEAQFLSSPFAKEGPNGHTPSLKLPKITTQVARSPISIGPPTVTFDVSLEQITLRRDDHAVTYPVTNTAVSYLDLLSGLRHMWRQDEMDLGMAFDAPYIVFYPPNYDEDNAWSTLDIEEVIGFNDLALESGNDSERWMVDELRGERANKAMAVGGARYTQKHAQEVKVLDDSEEGEGTDVVYMRGGEKISVEYTEDDAFLTSSEESMVERENDAAMTLLGLQASEHSMGRTEWVRGMEAIDTFVFN